MNEEKKFYFTYNNLKLCGILNKINETNEIVVICHARTSSKDSRPTTNLANELTKNNINNFRFDFVSCGESDGNYNEYTVSKMITNLEDTLKMLKQDYNYTKFILIGCSMGGRIVSLINSEKYDVEKIILWYPALNYHSRLFNLPTKKEKIAKKQGFYTIEKGCKLSYEYFKDERKYLAYKNLYKFNIPICFIHGTNDPYVSYKNTVKISKKIKNAKLILINDADHGFHKKAHMKEAMKETIEFIKENKL